MMAGPEFGELCSHHLVVCKALCGLHTSGLRWHERFAACTCSEGFFPCITEPHVWMRRNGNVHECVSVHVDDLETAMLDPKSFIDNLEQKHHFESKGSGGWNFHLGADFTCDADGTSCVTPTKHIKEQLVSSHVKMFGSEPSMNVSSLLEHGDHPELDNTEPLDNNGIQHHQ